MESPAAGTGFAVKGSVPLLSTVNEASINLPTGEKAVFPRELLRQTAAALGLPIDTLSVTLLAFSRLFSFTVTPALMGTLRREFLASFKSSSPGDIEKAVPEAEVLAMVAAFDKGVTLSAEALEQYARFFLPPVYTGEPGAEDDVPPKGDATVPGNKGVPPDSEEAPGESEVQAIAEKQTQEDTVLDFLNSLPGKNGQYWTVFPFKIKVRGIELSVFIRILKREFFSATEGEYLIADIVGPKRQWRCFLRKRAGKFRTDIRIYPKMSPRALRLLQKEAERFLGERSGLSGNFEGFGEILVQNGEGAASWMEDLYTECLPSINRQV